MSRWKKNPRPKLGLGAGQNLSKGGNDMPDPTLLLVKGGLFVLAAFSIVRILLHEYYEMADEFQRRKRRRSNKVQASASPRVQS